MSSETVQMEDTEFLDEMLPASEKTALLFNMSYLCLAKFPSLERLIRERAVESQMLFSSSATTLLQCVCTSKKMVRTLLPMLKVCIEEQDIPLANQYQEKASVWIDEIVNLVDQIEKKYVQLNRDVASVTSDVVETKTQTEERIVKVTHELMLANQCVDEYNMLPKIQSDLNVVNSKIQEADKKIEDRSESIASRNSKSGTDTVVSKMAVETAKEKLNRLQQDEDRFSKQEWMAQTEVKNQINLSRAAFEKGVLPDPIHLNEVQSSLSKIQKILLDLRKFWERFGVILKNNLSLSASTDKGLELFVRKSRTKQKYLTDLETIEKDWKMFGDRCRNIMNGLILQSKDSYKFLETSPSTLSTEEWQKQYDAVSERLISIYSTVPQLQITEGQKDPKKE